MGAQDDRLEPNGKWLFFRADIEGGPAIYAAEVAKAR